MEGQRSNSSHMSLVRSNAMAIAKAYLLTSMVKFPLVFSKNGILNAILVIGILGGVCSALSNFFIAKLAQKLGEDTYLGLSKKLSGRMHPSVTLFAFIQRSLGILYSIDLSVRFIKTIEMFQFGNDIQILCFLFAVLLSLSFVFSDPASLSFARSRNILAFLVLSIITIATSFSRFPQNQARISLKNNAESFFDSFGLTAICFAQQLITAPLCAADYPGRETSIALGGAVSALAYMSIGLAGYISCPAPDVNWLASCENVFVRSLCSAVLLGVNIATFPLMIDPIKKELESVLPQTGLNKSSIISVSVAVAFYTFASIYFVASKYGVICCLFFSSFIMLIFPSLFYLKTYKVGTRGRMLAALNIIVGAGLVCKAAKDLAWLFIQ